MAKGIFVTGTGTDVGKTFATALIVKKIVDAGKQAAYYKAALSGAETIGESDAGYVKKVAGLEQPDETLLTYLYKNAVSPHLAAKIEGNPVDLTTVKTDFETVASACEYVTVEGSGGIVCPIRWDTQKILLEDIIKTLDLDVLLVADAGLGTINVVVLTVEYLRQRQIRVKGILCNHYTGGQMQEDNICMIEELTKIPVIAKIAPEDQELHISVEHLLELYR